MSEENYKTYYEMKATYDNDKNDKKTTLKKRTKHKYPNGELYVNNWKQTDIITIDKIKNMKGICISCNKPDMKFIDKNGKIGAYCDHENSCGYNFEIEIPESAQYYDLTESLNKNIEELKSNIVTWKLNLLYNLDDEDVVLNEFQKLKGELDWNTKLLKKIKKEHLKKDVLTIEENGENIPISRKKLIEKYTKNINLQKENYKNILQNYIKNDLKDNSIKDAMILHQTIMKDINKKRDITFELGNIEIITNKNQKGEIENFTLYKKIKNYKNLEHELTEIED